MYNNYENRVKEFIIDMNNQETKIEIKDYEGRINNPKTEMSKDKEYQKPFIFKGYTTEEDRIKDSIKRNRYLYNLPDYEEIINKDNLKKTVNKTFADYNFNINIPNKKIINQKLHANKRQSIRGLSEREVNKYEYILKNDLIIQPEMRFKPRTDLERLYDIINNNKYGQAQREKQLLDKQLKNLDLYKYKNRHELNDLIKKKIKENINHNNSFDKNISYANRYEIYDDNNKKNKLYYNPKNNKLKPWTKRDDLNEDAHKILTSYHYKTHFKAAKEVASNKSNSKEKSYIDINISNEKNNNNNNYLSSSNSPKIKKKEKPSCLLLPNLFKKKYYINKSATEGNNLLENTIFDKKNKNNNNLIDININRTDDVFNYFKTDNFDKNENNDYNDDYKKNQNPFKRKIFYDRYKIKALNNIAFQKVNNSDDIVIQENNTNTFDEMKINNNNNDKNCEDNNNNISIGGEILDKNEQFDIITNKILGSCNILKHKSRYNDTIHKKRDGKLMITHGLSIQEFEKKYGFK